MAEMTGQLAFDIDSDGTVSPEEAKEYLEDNEAVNYETFHDKVWPNVKEILEKEREKREGTEELVKGDTDQPALPTPRPTITPPTEPVVFPTPPPLDREPPIEAREDLGKMMKKTRSKKGIQRNHSHCAIMVIMKKSLIRRRSIYLNYRDNKSGSKINLI